MAEQEREVCFKWDEREGVFVEAETWEHEDYVFCVSFNLKEDSKTLDQDSIYAWVSNCAFPCKGL